MVSTGIDCNGATTDDETMDRNLFGKMLAAHLPDEQALTSAPAH